VAIRASAQSDRPHAATRSREILPSSAIDCTSDRLRRKPPGVPEKWPLPFLGIKRPATADFHVISHTPPCNPAPRPDRPCLCTVQRPGLPPARTCVLVEAIPRRLRDERDAPASVSGNERRAFFHGLDRNGQGVIRRATGQIAGGLQPTVWQSKEPPASAPMALARFWREKRGLASGLPNKPEQVDCFPMPVYRSATTSHCDVRYAENRITYFSNTFSIWPTFFWTLPASFSFWPSAVSLGLSVTFPAFSLVYFSCHAACLRSDPSCSVSSGVSSFPSYSFD
jgi:hypothetical protein